jgi:hypothetical protein
MKFKSDKQRKAVMAKLRGLATFYRPINIKNKGVFYRGTAKGRGVGTGALGKGVYITWDKGAAEAFSRISAQKNKYDLSSAKVTKYKLPKDLKLLDANSKTMQNIKVKLGVAPRDKVGDPIFATALRREILKKGKYDGVISDDKYDGIVIFNEEKLKRQD